MKVHSPSGNIVLQPKEGLNLTIEEDVYRYFEPIFKEELDHFLQCFESFNRDVLEVYADRDELDGLPYCKSDQFWKERQNDLRIISEQLKANSEVLEIGSWNGWLANSLSKKGHTVTSIDYFLNESEGLKSRRFYAEPKWTSIHMDVDDIDHLEPIFDAVIFNRSIAYYNDFNGLIKKAERLLFPGGKIILTGLNVAGNTDQLNAFHNESDERFQNAFGRSIEIKGNSKKNLLDKDLDWLVSEGFDLIKRDTWVRHAVKRYLLKKRCRTYTAVATFTPNTV